MAPIWAKSLILFFFFLLTVFISLYPIWQCHFFLCWTNVMQSKPGASWSTMTPEKKLTDCKLMACFLHGVVLLPSTGEDRKLCSVSIQMSCRHFSTVLSCVNSIDLCCLCMTYVQLYQYIFRFTLLIRCMTQSLLLLHFSYPHASLDWGKWNKYSYGSMVSEPQASKKIGVCWSPISLTN